MSNTLLKKATASIAALSVVCSMVSPVVGVRADDASVEAANRLAALGVIVDNAANPSAYNLNGDITRREMLKIMMNLSSVEVTDSCTGAFADLNSSDWGCKYAEAALNAGFIAANTNFRPNDLVSKSEALKMIMQAKGIAKAEGVEPWQAAYVSAAIEAGVLSAEFTDYTTQAKRSMVITTADSAVTSTSTTVEEDDMELDLGDIFGDIDLGDADEATSDETMTDEETTSDETMTDEETTSDETMTDEETTVSAEGDVLEVTLSPENPAGVNLPLSAAGVQVLKFDVTAGEEDVEVTGLTFSRDGFGLEGVNEIAAYSDNGRISKTNDFDSDDISELTVTDFTVKAGSTETITVLANTTSESTKTGEFYITLEDVEASSDVELDSVVSEVFDVNNTDAAVLNIVDQGVNSSVNSGESAADLAEFKVKNDGKSGSSDVSMKISSLTFREVGSIDQEDALSNFVLLADGDEIATVDSMVGKYLTFNFDTITIEDGKNVVFKLQADINGGAGENVQFVIEDKMDVLVSASKYNAAQITADDGTSKYFEIFDSVNVDAGELTVYAVDADSDEIRSDKEDVELGQFKVVNTSGKSLELTDFNVQLALTTTGTTTDTLAEVFTKVEMVINNSSEELDPTNDALATTMYGASDLSYTIPEGTTYITVRADTAKDIDNGVVVEMTLDIDGDDSADDTDDNVIINETEDDEQVTDISPNSLSWDDLTVTNSSVKVSNVPLADVNVVKGSSDLVAMQFEIKAGSASSVTLDKVYATVLAGATGSTAATSDEVSSVALYKGSVSDSNLLDQVSGSKLSSAGLATFDGFEVEIDADETETFIVTVSLADIDTLAGQKVKVTIDPTKLSLEDSDTDTVTATESTLSDKVITVTAAGELSIAYDSSNDANEEAKTILAGETQAIVSYDINSVNEEIDVEEVTFTLNATTKTSIETADLYLDGVKIATADNSDITDGTTTSTILFEDMSDLIIPTESVELELRLNTANIGYEKVGTALSNVAVTSIEINKAKGVDSNEDVAVNDTTFDTTFDGKGTLTATSEVFAVVPAVVTPTVYTSLNTSTTPQISIYANAGSNSETGSLTTPKTYVDQVKFSLLGTTDANSSIVYKLVNSDDSTDSVTGSVVGNVLTFDLTAMSDVNNRSISSSSTERFKVVITGTETDTDTIELTLTKDGITYTVAGSTVSTNLSDEIEFGSRTY